ncbi:MAG: hypothetical protein V4510_08145 [bacterium]
MSDAEAGAPEKPAILRESRFTVEEGVAYRACRTGAIWMNKLFFSSLILLCVWLVYGGLGGQTGCGQYPVPTLTTGPYAPVVEANRTVDAGTHASCNIFLTPTSEFLAAMAVITFLLSILFGVLGLVVGKRVLEAARAEDEVGAGTKKP